MKLTIHRGTNEIGGICIEIQSGISKILIDFGLPLVSKSGDKFNFRPYENLSSDELVKNGVLPDIENAYSENSNISGVLISHPHADHYGLMQYLDKNIPVYSGRATHDILMLNNVFLFQRNHIEKPYYFEKNLPFQVGDFTITPYWNDHSAFDAYSFLIESNGKRIFYSGDFRGHGRKNKVFKWFTHNAPENIDCLIMEGTSIGKANVRYKTEMEIEQDLTEIFRSSNCINYIYTSSQNIDRMVSIYKACIASGKTFVVDIYTANVLHVLSKYAQLPSPLKGYAQLKVLYPHKTTTSLFNRGYEDLANDFVLYKITKEEISKNPSNFVLIVRPSMKIDLVKIKAEKGQLIYSMWKGYKEDSSSKAFIAWLEARNFSIIDVHTSGHADVETLKKYADSINPKTIIPIHTFNKQDYKGIFTQSVFDVDDNQEVDI